MNGKDRYVSIGGGGMHFLQWGHGSRLLLGFHGYGNDANVFLPFVPFLKNEYTILSFDLPHHGDSIWNDTTPLRKEDIVTLVKDMMNEHEVDKVSMMGYSMGGRVCLTIIELMPGCIDGALLMASDGLTSDFYTWFFTRTMVGKKLFNGMLRKPSGYLKFLDWLKEMKLLDESRHKFGMKYIKTAQSRDFLRRVWPVMKEIAPDIGKVKEAIRKYCIPIYLFMGAHDKIMPPSRSQRFKKGLDSVKLYVLQKGHRVFDEDNAGEIAKVLL